MMFVLQRLIIEPLHAWPNLAQESILFACTFSACPTDLKISCNNLFYERANSAMNEGYRLL